MTQHCCWWGFRRPPVGGRVVLHYLGRELLHEEAIVVIGLNEISHENDIMQASRLRAPRPAGASGAGSTALHAVAPVRGWEK